jgi:vacuolar-type H+-ATPase subunit H
MTEDPFAEDGDGDDGASGVHAPPPDADAETLIRHAIDTVSTARAMPLSSSVLVARDELLDLLQAALERLPKEMRDARWLLRERDEFLDARQREADNILDEVRVQAERMVQRTEIVRQANQVAQRIIEDAREESRRLRHEAEDFCDQKLASFEIVLDRTMRIVQSGREKLQATPLPAESVTAVDDTGEAKDAELSGFFDQDDA